MLVITSRRRGFVFAHRPTISLRHFALDVWNEAIFSRMRSQVGTANVLKKSFSTSSPFSCLFYSWRRVENAFPCRCPSCDEKLFARFICSRTNVRDMHWSAKIDLVRRRKSLAHQISSMIDERCDGGACLASFWQRWGYRSFFWQNSSAFVHGFRLTY